MRCPKCGNEVDLKSMECDRCGLATPKTKSGSLKPDRVTGSLKKPQKTWLPPFLANHPLNKIKIPPALAIFLVFILPLSAAGYYFYNEWGICINCASVGGTYTTEIPIGDKQVKLDIVFFQYGSVITGQVRFAVPPEVETGDKNKDIPTIYIEEIDKLTIGKTEVLFETKPSANAARTKFLGQVENNVLKGSITITKPELNCNNKSFPISIKKT